MRIANTVNDFHCGRTWVALYHFTQGCPHHCPGCHNPDTHDPAGGREVSLEELIAEMGRNPFIEGRDLLWRGTLCPGGGLQRRWPRRPMPGG